MATELETSVTYRKKMWKFKIRDWLELQYLFATQYHLPAPNCSEYSPWYHPAWKCSGNTLKKTQESPVFGMTAKKDHGYVARRGKLEFSGKI